VIADVACYTASNPEEATNSCAREKWDQEDKFLCSQQEYCFDCVGTFKNDGYPCMWFEDGNFCDSHCNMFGCGEEICPNIFDECETETMCTSCLNSGCAWAASSCISSCNVIADVACYTASNPEEATNSCAREKWDQEDKFLCSQQEYCFDCVGTLKNDGSPCMWFEDGNYCDSQCNMFGCGDYTCYN